MTENQTEVSEGDTHHFTSTVEVELNGRQKVIVNFAIGLDSINWSKAEMQISLLFRTLISNGLPKFHSQNACIWSRNVEMVSEAFMKKTTLSRHHEQNF